MRINGTKLIAIILFSMPLLLLGASKPTPVNGVAIGADDPAVKYKAQCAACHLPNASKFYDPTHPDEHHIEVILKGKRGAKPPFMPGYEAKGMTAEEAKSLAELMRKLRTSQ